MMLQHHVDSLNMILNRPPLGSQKKLVTAGILLFNTDDKSKVLGYCV